jgi:hypothetical protein
MKPVQTTSGISGVAKVEVHPSQPKVKVTLKPTEEGAKPVSYVIEKEDCPEYVRSGMYMVNLSGDGKKMYSIRPITGMAKFRVKQFMAKKDAEPAPKTVNGKFGPYMTFAVEFEIVEGENKGMTIPGSYPFDFIESMEEVPGKGTLPVLNVKKKQKSPGNDRLWELLEVSGVISLVMPYKENPLPMLQKHMLHQAKVFTGAYKDGWMTSLFASEESFA